MEELVRLLAELLDYAPSPHTATRIFEVLITANEKASISSAEFGDLVDEQLGAENLGNLADTVHEYLLRSGGLNALAPVVQSTVPELTACYDGLLAEHEPVQPGATAEATGAADASDGETPGSAGGNWNEFLAENGPRWDGTEQAWGPFKEWFLYTAREQGVTQSAESFIAYVDADQDKAAVFAQYGVTIAPAPNPNPHEQEQDEGQEQEQVSQ
jgi:hypothetical protein